MTRPSTPPLSATLLIAATAFVGGAVGASGQDRPHGGRRFDETFVEDRAAFHFLLERHEAIRRTVTQRPDGVETLTESDDPEVAAKIREHVAAMKTRLEKGDGVRLRDPLFAKLFRAADRIEMKIEPTKKGARVVERSDDPAVVELIRAHAKVVSGFAARGFQEARKSHAVPTADASSEPALSYPKIPDAGGVYRFPNAPYQPREGAKLCIDLTRGSAEDELNPAIKKLPRFVNLYAGGGAKAAKADLRVVLHGDAIRAALTDDAYAAATGTRGNPNLALMRTLHESGVTFVVCGQSLRHAGQSPEDVAPIVEVAVSALTAVVNLQQDGFAYVPMH